MATFRTYFPLTPLSLSSRSFFLSWQRRGGAVNRRERRAGSDGSFTGATAAAARSLSIPAQTLRSLSQCKNARTAKGAASDRPTPPASQRVSGRGDAIQQMVRNRPQWVERIEGRQWRAFNPNLSPAGLQQCLAKDWTDTVPLNDSVNVHPEVPLSSARKT